MNKRKIKKILFIFLLIFVISFIPFFNGKNIYKKVSMTVNNPVKKLSAERQLVYDKMKVDYVNVKTRTTGTAPFNTGVSNSDADGNDVSDSDDYIRTFDTMKYLVEVGIVPNISGDTSSLKGGVIKVKAKLPTTSDGKTIMRWEQDAWMQNVQYSNDKTEIYAEYHISNNTNVANANQNLSFTVKLDGYKVDITDDMKPSFEIWMEGNTPDNESSSANSVSVKDERDIIISGHESFDIVVVNGGYLNLKGEREIDGVNTTGQYVNYDAAVALYQDNNGFDDLRGISYPSTDEFNINLKMLYYYRHPNESQWHLITEDTTNAKDIINGAQIIEWGLNREDKPNYYPTSNYVSGAAILPAGRLGNPVNSVQDSGTMSLTNNKEKITMTFKNYTLNGIFPDRGWGHTQAQSSFKNNGYFAAGNFEIFIPYYDEDGTGDYVYQYAVQVESATTKAMNGRIIEISKGETTINDKQSNNNSASVIINSKVNGSAWGIIRSLNSDGSEPLDKEYNYGNGSVLLGKDFTLFAPYRMYDGPYEGGVDAIIAWNAKTFQIEKLNDNNIIEFKDSSINGYPSASQENIKYYFGIYKSNPSEGITDNTDVNGALYEDFNWFENLEEAKRNGKVSAIYINDPDMIGYTTQRDIKLRFSAIDDIDNINKVGIFRYKWRFYEDKERTKVYYYGGKNNYESNNGYEPTIYNSDGTLTYEVSENYGESVLVIGEKASVITSVSDLDSSLKPKKSYDVQEGKINVKLTPTLTNDRNITDADPYSENVVVKTTLPVGLTYSNGSSNKEPSSVVVNTDGTTTITWIYDRWQVNHPAPEYPIITFAADISAALANNNNLEIKSTIKSEGDSRDETQFRTSAYGVEVSNLAGSMGLKEIDKNIIDKNESFKVKSTLGNNGQEKLNSVKTIELLPKNDDDKGSNFSGTYTIKIISGANGQRFFYSTNNIDDIGITKDKYDKDNIKDVDIINDTRWIEVNVGDVIPSDATAMATYLPELGAKEKVNYVIQILPNGNKEYDKYVFSLNMTSDNLSTAVKTNLVASQVVNRKISGIYYIDNNENNVYDSKDTLLKNKAVKLFNPSGTKLTEVKTNDDGKYEFEKLPKGNYIIVFEDNGINYKVISKGTEKGSSKVNSNYRTDTINQTVTATEVDYSIDNINIGISKKKAQVVVNHIYEDSNRIFKTDTIDKYFGDSYETSAINDIPVGYELSSTPSNASGTINQELIKVNYIYKKKDTNVDLKLTATGTKEINNSEDSVDYVINTTGTITNYVGDGTLIITSTLPYEIDENKSYLDGGVYNNQNRTITWTITKNINSYQNVNNVINVQRNIKVFYKAANINNPEMKNIVGAKIELNGKSEEMDSDVKTTIALNDTLSNDNSNNDNTDNNIRNEDGNKKVTSNPNTVDTIGKFIIMFIISLVSLLTIYIKKITFKRN